MSVTLLRKALTLAGNTRTIDTQPTKSDRGPNFDAYDEALQKLTCFNTPGCHPSHACADLDRTRPLNEGKGHWEKRNFCTGDLREASKRPGGCLVYSVGINGVWKWEQALAAEFGCEVYTFDPTVTHRTNVSKKVYFYKLGLKVTFVLCPLSQLAYTW
jgi:hypothetical protein